MAECLEETAKEYIKLFNWFILGKENRKVGLFTLYAFFTLWICALQANFIFCTVKKSKKGEKLYYKFI